MQTIFLPNWNGVLPDVPAVKLIAGADGLTPELPNLKPPATQIAIQSK
jgi:hypothetical protein